ncbi:DUF2190 family protein [Xanthobacter versatilis]|uniref:DUF2190 family protein n=1 Tax=Xanthobacter autotrophicus (strain ATCC BAA-1158 / Py2) TaxID=78245 RepID=UPI00372B9207
MRNYVQPGDTVTFTAPAGGLASGAGALIGSLFGVAAASAAAGADVELVTRGVFDLPKAAGIDFAAGERAYWSTAAKAVTDVAAGNTLIGVATRATAIPATTVRVRLNGVAI